MTNDRRRRLLTRDESLLWRQIMKEAQPLPGRDLPEDPDEPPPVPELAPLPKQSDYQRLREVLPPGYNHPPQRLDHGKTAGIDRRTADRMTKGEMVIDGRLDLHGMYQDAAHAALRGFVMASSNMGRRCLLVITGKGNREGSGVLRQEVPRWLNEPALRPFVLAFSYAKPQHGGEGALYVLLKRHR
jgi:DNA-nicking Smr family endonuclease